MVSARLYSDRLDRVVRPVHTTVAPASPKAAAMPRPAPRVAPATTATRPRSASGSGDHAIARPYRSADSAVHARHKRPIDLQMRTSVMVDHPVRVMPVLVV